MTLSTDTSVQALPWLIIWGAALLCALHLMLHAHLKCSCEDTLLSLLPFLFRPFPPLSSWCFASLLFDPFMNRWGQIKSKKSDYKANPTCSDDRKWFKESRCRWVLVYNFIKHLCQSVVAPGDTVSVTFFGDDDFVNELLRFEIERQITDGNWQVRLECLGHSFCTMSRTS